MLRPPWDVFTQGLPPDPRGKYFRVWADPRPEEIAAVAGAIQTLEQELLLTTIAACLTQPGRAESASQEQRRPDDVGGAARSSEFLLA